MSIYSFEPLSIADKVNALQHHGILGQKWGVRRFQNPDGTLTAAGRRRYLNSDASLKSSASKKIDVQKYENALSNSEKIRSLTKEMDSLDKKLVSKVPIEYCTSSGRTGNTESKEWKYAATLGIKALNKMTGNSFDPNDEDFHDWFLFEDQTIGLGTIARLSSSGYTSKEIKQLISDAKKLSDLSWEKYKLTGSKGFRAEDQVFELFDPDGKKAEFADVCEKIRIRDLRKKLKNSKLTNRQRELVEIELMERMG